MTSIDARFAQACTGDADAFGAWMERVHRPLRESLRRFARAVDVEVVVQEAFLRMWLVACDPARRLEGENASLRFALRVARNVALEEVRRYRIGRLVPLDAIEDPPEAAVPPEPPSDPGLRRAIVECLAALPARAGAALRARIEGRDVVPDRDLAAAVGMTLNTFLQNVVRGRRYLTRCLDGRGVALGGIAR